MRPAPVRPRRWNRLWIPQLPGFTAVVLVVMLAVWILVLRAA